MRNIANSMIPILHHPSEAPIDVTAASSDVVISCQGVSKVYRIYDKPQDRLKQMLFWRFGRSYGRDFWAVKDVTLQILRGQSVGIVGRNGSGKSTLLQMIAGILQPTHGQITVSGRVSALLELGAGFNVEYTGRENVFLSGAILGITRQEMEDRFDAIAAFADIGEFIDQPVKTYSSGMFARLAFSVAISVDPDILIVDEILAVGDYGFQQKCITRMRQLRDNGLTLLFVSHSPDTIKSTCSQGLFLVAGQPMYWGSAEQAVNQYFMFMRNAVNQEALDERGHLPPPMPFKNTLPGVTRYGTGHVQIDGVLTRSDTGEEAKAFAFGSYVNIDVTLHAYVLAENLSLSFIVRDLAGIDLMGTTSFDEQYSLPTLRANETIQVRLRFKNELRLGNFGISLAINQVTKRDYSDNVLFDQVDGVTYFVTVPDPNRPVHYKFHVPVEFKVLS